MTCNVAVGLVLRRNSDGLRVVVGLVLRKFGENGVLFFVLLLLFPLRSAGTPQTPIQLCWSYSCGYFLSFVIVFQSKLVVSTVTNSLEYRLVSFLSGFVI